MPGPSTKPDLVDSGHVASDQSEVFAFLGDPTTHGILFPVVRIDTHTAAVFLAGLDVYKVKRAIRFPFLDLSTLEKRRSACEAEVAVNRSYAPDLYFGAVPIIREGGRLHIGGRCEAIEWAVHLRRFDETRTLDHVAERRQLGAELVGRLAEVVLATYREAEIRDGAAATLSLEGVVEETLASLARSDVFPPEETAGLGLAMKACFTRLRPLLLIRGERGKVRRCHGDLHLRNVVLLNGAPTLFDAIEFDEAIATIDILYDLAFLLMDLWERGLHPQANLLLNRYLWGSPDLAGELEGLATLPLFLSLRGAVRAKVEALRYLDVSGSERVRQEARRYQTAAHAFLAKAPARLIAIGGLSGTGKSTLAAHVAPAIGRPPGAVHLRSDIERKRLFGVSELDRLPVDAYAEAATERVFAALREQAAIALKAGQSVIVDAVHHRPAERDMIAAVAERLGVPFTGLWLDAPLGVLTERVAVRRRDASDATAAVVARQAEEPAGPIAWTRLDATASPDTLSATALAAVGGGQRRDPSRQLRR